MNSFFPTNINVESIAALPLGQFGGRIIMVDNLESLHGALKMLHGHMILGFDTETKPTFKKGRTHNVAMLQLSNHDTCYIFRLNKIGLCDELVHLLSNPSIIKVGLSLKDDFRELSKMRIFKPAGFVDLQSYVEKFGIQDKSLKKLTAMILGIRISKSQQTSNWEAERLSESQLIYAATDAWACIEIYKKLRELETNLHASSTTLL
jgi:ribonuclease D